MGALAVKHLSQLARRLVGTTDRLDAIAAAHGGTTVSDLEDDLAAAGVATCQMCAEWFDIAELGEDSMCYDCQNDLGLLDEELY